MMGFMCPFIKSECIGKECFMREGERCLIRAYLEKSVLGEAQAGTAFGRLPQDPEKERILVELDSCSVEDLSDKLLSFAKTKFPEDTSVLPEWDEIYLKSRHAVLSGRDMSSNTHAKFADAKRQAESRLHEERKIEREERYKREKTELPGLVEACTDWARQKGLKKLSESDIDVFLAERNIRILMEIKRLLHTTVSFKLKSII
jgi:hypothetical protein